MAIRCASVRRAKRDGVTAAFRSKTRRLLALPRPWRTHAPHFRVRRPQQWPPIPSWFVHSVKGARSPPLRLALQTCPRRASTRNDTGTMVGHCGWYLQPRTVANTSQRPRTEPRAAAAAYDHRVLRQHFGHSGAIPAASAGEIQQTAACTRRPQRWGARIRSFGTLYGRIKGPVTRLRKKQ